MFIKTYKFVPLTERRRGIPREPHEQLAPGQQTAALEGMIYCFCIGM